MSDHHPIDVHIGARMRERRSLLGISQTCLGKTVGVTFQQIQKYERGANKIRASRLFELAAVLDVSVTYFFDGLHADAARTPISKEHNAPLPRLKEDLLSAGETLKLVRAYYNILPPEVRKSILTTMRSLGAGRMPSSSNQKV